MDIFSIVLGVVFWWALAFIFVYIWENRKSSKARFKYEELLKEATTKKEEILDKARKESEDFLKQKKLEAEESLKQAKQESTLIMEKVTKTEQRVLEREEKFQQRLDEIDKKQELLLKKEEELKDKKQELNNKIEEFDWKIAEMSKLTEEQAKELFLAQISEKYGDEGMEIIEKYKKKIEDKKKETAREILIKAVQQYSSDVTNEVTTTVIEIPSDDIKGKLIGKEGRNITTFEKATWVSLIIDDTPDSVFISSFDLYRRYIAKKSLEKLIEDGRIQPARIEEIVEKTYEEGDILLKELGTKTIEEMGISDIPEDIIPIIGKLRFRTSYGQNILKHSKEVAYIAEALARELWVDQNLVKKWGLLHDIGKALDHDIEGTHPEIGGKLARKYNMNPKIIDIIENHHEESYSISIEAAIVQIADAISSVRPWARREVIEQYLKRIQEMEALVQSFSWVNKAYAISAWREVRVFVDADTVSDLQAQEMARNIAIGIHNELAYPWEVKVSLIREMRVIEYAK